MILIRITPNNGSNPFWYIIETNGTTTIWSTDDKKEALQKSDELTKLDRVKNAIPINIDTGMIIRTPIKRKR